MESIGGGAFGHGCGGKKKTKWYDLSWEWWGDIDENRKIGIAAFLSAAYFICLPLSIVTLPGGMSLLKAVTYVLGAVLVARLFVGRDWLRLNSIQGLYVVYSLFDWFIIRTDGAYTTLRGILEISLIFVMITSRVYNEREGNFMFNSWIVVGVITTVSVLLGQIFKIESVFGRVSVFIGGAEDPNQLCEYSFIKIRLSR